MIAVPNNKIYANYIMIIINNLGFIASHSSNFVPQLRHNLISNNGINSQLWEYKYLQLHPHKYITDGNRQSFTYDFDLLILLLQP
ncbi:hypothetical protein FDUTEX481_09377 [Tolypothrix sp. PCC 7601]|nr:hypothetical protein FDUTEX481_09377 [Tolypothrix sp. PCC 7601]BAY91211.1 hypothetical protein NIES3275_32340 [Microchaete diplosiphon NIES-3275]